ncbi:MAG: type II toxin-antitoxin system prevent-host-death family antitoxin [Chloroflexi bacterium]|nr:type II toxin-antitoxin system prevent-host-death family antitoxin [Chloroflexota bacterium]
MRTVGAYEAKTRFSELLAEVANGETVVVTKHGVPVAHIVPVGKSFEDAAAAIEAWRRYRREHNITLGEGLTIRELIAEGRE